MKISIVMPAHRPRLIRRFMNSMVHMAPFEKGVDIEVCIAASGPVTYDMLVDYGVDKFIILPTPEPNEPFPFVEYTARAMELGTGDYFLRVDDDLQFKPAKGDRPSSGTYFMEAYRWLVNNPDVGVMCTRGYLGGSAWQYEIRKDSTNGLISTNVGILTKNVPVAMPNEEERKLLGTMEESVMAYRVLADGFTYAKRFYNPTTYDYPIPRRSGERLKPNYTPEVIQKYGGGYIQRRYKDRKWTHERKKFPAGMLVEQRINRRKRRNENRWD